MANTARETQLTGKWWGSSMTIWGAIITGLSTVLPALGPAFGIDVTGDLCTKQARGSCRRCKPLAVSLGTIMTIYGRARASKPLEQRNMQLKL